MKCLITSALASILLLATSLAQAAGLASNVTITQIESLAAGQVFVYFSSPATGSPCATNPNAFVFDGTTTAGKTLMSIFLVAYAQGVKVTSGGTGTCTFYSGYETANYVITLPSS